MLQSVNHICFSVSNLEKSIEFYQGILEGKLLVKGRTTAYLEIAGLWIALNEEHNVKRNPVSTYTHIAFTVSEQELDYWSQKFSDLDVNILKGRKRHSKDKKSIYFTDPDYHLFELHTGNLEDRLEYYKKEKKHMIFFDND